MYLDESLKNQLIEKLRSLSPERVILFGSYAYGKPHMDSDIDLVVVLNEDFIPANFKENMQLYLKVSSTIRDVKRNHPVDLIVYTKPMYEKSVNLGSGFIREISSKGVRLL